MQANPDKFQGLALGKRAFDRKPTFSIKGAEIECTEDAKLLGVDIDYMLNFNTHIKNVCRRASRQINVLKRIGKYLPIKLVIYHAFIMSIFNFCPLAWHYCRKGNTDKLEKLHFRALKFVYQDFTSSYENLLIRADTYSLNVKRIRLIALEVFKIISDDRPPYLSKLIIRKETQYSCRYSNMLQVPNVRTETYGRNSFRFNCTQIWNTLPEHIRTTTKLSKV